MTWARIRRTPSASANPHAICACPSEAGDRSTGTRMRRISRLPSSTCTTPGSCGGVIEYRPRRLTKHALGRRAEEQLADAGEAMRADHDEVARALARDAKDFRRRLANGRFVLQHRELRRVRAERSGRELLDLVLRLLGCPHRAGAKIGGLRQQRILDRQHDQPRRKVIGNRRRVTQRTRRRLGEIDRAED